MSAFNSLINPGSFQFRKRTTVKGRCARRPRLIAQHRSEIEPQQRLHKLSREAASPKLVRLELLAFLFLGVLVGAAAAYCSTELFDVINSGALDQTVQTLLSK
jgi:hypothetical protein